MRKIIANEWLHLFRNRFLQIVGVVFFSIFLLSVFLGNLQNRNQKAQYETAHNHLRQQWESIDSMNPHGAAHYGTYLFKPNNLLSGLDEGVSGVTGRVLRVEGHVQNEIVHSEASQMQAVAKFGRLKSSLLLQYLLPLLLIFLAFHSISSEKQSGRLKLLILQGAQPRSLLFAKTLAVWLFGLLLLTLTLLTYVAINLKELNGDMLLRSALFFLSYAIYYYTICGLTVLASARWQNSTLALTSMLGIWILWTIFLPNILMGTVENWHELPSRNEFQANMKEDRSKGLDGHNPQDERAQALKEKVLLEYSVDSLSQLPINFDGIRMQADEEYGNQVWDKHFGNLDQVLRQQKRTYQLGGILNPFVSLQNASMGFSGSDNLHHQNFLLQAENYRRDFIKALNDNQAFGGSKTGDWGWNADNNFYRSVPDFSYQPLSLALAFSQYLLDLMLLSVWAVVATALLVLGAKKMQVL